jgi:hypothetical protein
LAPTVAEKIATAAIVLDEATGTVITTMHLRGTTARRCTRAVEERRAGRARRARSGGRRPAQEPR